MTSPSARLPTSDTPTACDTVLRCCSSQSGLRHMALTISTTQSGVTSAGRIAGHTRRLALSTSVKCVMSHVVKTGRSSMNIAVSVCRHGEQACSGWLVACDCLPTSCILSARLDSQGGITALGGPAAPLHVVALTTNARSQHELLPQLTAA